MPKRRDSFRSVVQDLRDHDDAVEIVSYRHLFTATTYTPRGSPDCFVFHFHDPMRVLTPDGMRATPAECLVAHTPYSPIVHSPRRGDRYLRSWLRLSGAGYQSLIAACAPTSRWRWAATPRSTAGSPSCVRSVPRRNVPTRARCVIWSRSGCGRPAADRLPAPVVAVRELLAARFRSPITLADCAERAGCSPSQIGRLFRRHPGCGPITYLLRLRLDHAADLLIGTGIPVGKIAAQCGFTDLPYFSRCFQRHRGCSPSQLRTVAD